MADVLWPGPAFLAAIDGELRGDAPRALTGISIDSRTLKPGEAFFAITGDRHDGHNFIAQALTNGAAVAVVEAAKTQADAPGPLLVVPDALKALEALGRAARARSFARIVAVTGSVGKTGTKEMLRQVLQTQGRVHASAASFNNHWGVPLTLARLPDNADYAVFEIGMNHAGEITPLVAMVRPHIAIVTNVEPVHIEFFESVEAIADAKAEIFSGLEPGGVAVLNADNAQFDRLAAAAAALGIEVRNFGAAARADARVLTVAALPERSIVTASILGTEIVYSIGAPGRHVVQNSLGVLLAAKLAGVDVKAAADALAAFASPAGRGQRHLLDVGGGQAVLFDESYNANPASMRAAIALLAAAPAGNGRRIAVLGDMLELGAQSDALHRELAEVLVRARIDLVFTTGAAMQGLHDELPAELRGAWAQTASELEPHVLDSVRGGDAIMIKGSHGSGMGPIVASLIRRFGPAETAPA